MDTTEKVREARARRTLARRGFTLSRSRRRDPHALDYGLYTIHGWTDEAGEITHEASGLDDVEQWIYEMWEQPESPSGAEGDVMGLYTVTSVTAANPAAEPPWLGDPDRRADDDVEFSTEDES